MPYNNEKRLVFVQKRWKLRCLGIGRIQKLLPVYLTSLFIDKPFHDFFGNILKGLENEEIFI